MSNKSSIEWLFQKLWDTPIDKLNWYAIAEQAKEMHKQEINEAWDNGWHEHMNPPNVMTTSMDYYTETFGGNNEEI